MHNSCLLSYHDEAKSTMLGEIGNNDIILTKLLKITFELLKISPIQKSKKRLHFQYEILKQLFRRTKSYY